ncbi:dephospho-CoA kinase [Bdellovibrio bacteriovorus]|uniref:Dephospho-CoA kinase n=1 Tax=Bdellovibrio bacteriovorus TaxID=959 RepID=A0A150WNZ7_BDEBC|nr:dephospho-CoA kinase [Bdellovibrio bacteriovorus]KYG66027.1 dephospho-CoA kinase [Bdellovibrio bacteriovorus]
MKWIGLTGGIASGKSTVSQRLRELDFQLVDADEIARGVVQKGSPGLKSVLEKFGHELLDPEGHLNRRKLAQYVFDDPFKKLELEAILHPLIRAEVKRQREVLASQGHSLAIYDMPLLVESQAQAQFDKVVVVTCTLEQQKQRLRSRNQWTDKEIEGRLQAQVPLKEKEKYADFIVRNDKDRAHLETEILRLTKWLKSL